LTVSDQAAEQPSVEQGSLNLDASRPADAPSEPVAASAAEADPAKDAAASEAVVSEPVAAEPSMSGPALAEAPKAEPVKAEPVKAEPVKAEASAPASQPETTSGKTSPVPGKVIVMSRGDRAWTDHDIHVGPEEATPHGSVFGKRRIAAIAAIVALAIAAGALGGAFATATFMHGGSEVAKAGGSAAGSQTSLEASLSRIDSEVQALKSGLDHTSKLGMTQFNKTSERLDKVERAQADPAAKLAKLSEAVDRLRAAPAAAPVVAAATPATSSAAKDVTGSIGSASAQQQAAALAPKTEAKLDAKAEVGRLPTVEGWVLRDVAYGSALIDSRRGTYEVYAGDMIPGLGRVDAIRRQDGRWVVVTSRGLIVAR
jgi:uncharacterized protein YaiL (DUF2058 family)